MGYQMVMIASKSKEKIQLVKNHARFYDLQQVSRSTKSDGGWYGFCVLYWGARPRRDDPLARFLRECVRNMVGLKFLSKKLHPKSLEPITEDVLLTEWTGWLSSQETEGT